MKDCRSSSTTWEVLLRYLLNSEHGLPLQLGRSSLRNTLRQYADPTKSSALGVTGGSALIMCVIGSTADL